MAIVPCMYLLLLAGRYHHALFCESTTTLLGHASSLFFPSLSRYHGDFLVTWSSCPHTTAQSILLSSPTRTLNWSYLSLTLLWSLYGKGHSSNSVPAGSNLFSSAGSLLYWGIIVMCQEVGCLSLWSWSLSFVVIRTARHFPLCLCLLLADATSALALARR